MDRHISHVESAGLIAAQPLLRPGIEGISVFDARFVTGFLFGGGLVRRDHRLGFAQLLTRICQCDTDQAVAPKWDRLLPAVDAVAVAKRYRTCRRDSCIQAVTVICLVQLVLRLEVAQIGISQHQGGLQIYRDAMIENLANS